MKALTGTEPLYVQGHEIFLRNAHADWGALPGPTAITVHFLYAAVLGFAVVFAAFGLRRFRFES